MKSESLKALSESDILVRRAEVMRELMIAQFQLRTGQLENSQSLPKLRKNLARLNTELRQRELAQGLQKGTLLNRTASGAAEAPAGATEGAAPAKRSRFGLGFLRDTLLGRRS